MSSLSVAKAGAGLRRPRETGGDYVIGIDRGPDIDGLKSRVTMADGRSIIAAGGIRNARDLTAIDSAGARGALLATALHAQALTQNEIAALLRERRS